MVEGIVRKCVKWKIGRSCILGDVEVTGRNKYHFVRLGD